MTKLSTFRSLNPLFFRDEAMDRLWRQMWGGDAENQLVSGWSPSAELIDQPEAYLIKAEVPGLKAEEIHVDLHGDTLTIRGERKLEEKKDEEHYHVFERRYGAFHRSFAFPTAVAQDGVQADLADGVLTVRVQKKAESKPAKIQVKKR